MINYRTIIRVLGALLMLESAVMILPLLVSFIYGEGTGFMIFVSVAVTFLTGFTAHGVYRKGELSVGRREGFIIVTTSWILFSAFGTLPFVLTGSIPSFTDAFFETMSGFSTTGATILTDIEALPHSALFWRSIIQWMGGMGIVVLSIAIIGELKIGNFQLFSAEVPGVTKDKIHPRVKGTAKRLWAIYVALTVTETLLLLIGGMSPFDAICHSFTTMATGGFSTRNLSLAAFDSLYIHTVVTIFMFVGGINFALIYFVLKGKFSKLFGNDEFRFYVSVVVFFSLLVSLTLWIANDYTPGKAAVEGTFQVVSILTTTGFTSVDYQLWGHFLIMVVFMLWFTGASTGSTSGGIKMLRLLILTRNGRQELHKLIHPNAVLPVRINGKAIPAHLIQNVLAFVVFYFIILAVGVLVMSIMGYNIDTAFGASASALGNIGPAIGDVGPAFDFAHVPAFGKWFLSFLMLIGRLELFTVLILFSRTFYKS